MRKQNLRWLSAATLTATMIAALAGCGSSGPSDATSGPSGSDDTEFPESDFPSSVYGNLSGNILWYDPSGGAYTDAMESTLLKRFESLTGVKTQSEFNEGATKFMAAEEAGNVPWSIIQFGSKSDFDAAEQAGYLQPLADFVPTNMLQDGTYDDYGYAFDQYGIVLIYNKDKYPDEASAPHSFLDLYNTVDFPGKRCMFQYPEFGGTLESALMADGVAKDEVYPLDLDRAFAKLDTIKSDIVWWTSGDVAVQNVVQGECDLGVTWSGRAYDAIVTNRQNLGIVWQDAMYATGYVGIPKGAPNSSAGQALASFWLRDITGLEQRADLFPYVTPYNDTVDINFSDKVQPFIPLGDNLATALQQDDDFFTEHLTEVSDAFNAWVGQ